MPALMALRTALLSRASSPFPNSSPLPRILNLADFIYHEAYKNLKKDHERGKRKKIHRPQPENCLNTKSLQQTAYQLTVAINSPLPSSFQWLVISGRGPRVFYFTLTLPSYLCYLLRFQEFHWMEFGGGEKKIRM